MRIALATIALAGLSASSQGWADPDRDESGRHSHFRSEWSSAFEAEREALKHYEEMERESRKHREEAWREERKAREELERESSKHWREIEREGRGYYVEHRWY